MRRLVLLLVACALLVPGAARAAACSPLNCAPSQFTLAHGTMLALRGDVYKPIRVLDLRTGRTLWRLPPGIVTGDTLVHMDGNLVTWFDAATGSRRAGTALQQRARYALVGTSQDAVRAVLARTQHRTTTFAIVSRTEQRLVTLHGGTWQFDALDGTRLYLIRTLRDGYEVRLYDLAWSRLRPQPLKDPDESALIQGIPFSRASSPDGRYLFTLYIDGNGNAMVHELDTVAGRAHCVDLPGNGDFGSAITWAIVPGGNETLWAVSAGHGRVVAIDTASHAVRRSFAFRPGVWTSNAGVAVLSPDRSKVAYTDAQHIWLVDLARRTVAAGRAHTAVALGYSPGGRRLWVVGQRSRVSALAVR